MVFLKYSLFRFIIRYQIHKILFAYSVVFLCVGNPKTVLKGGYPGWDLQAHW